MSGHATFRSKARQYLGALVEGIVFVLSSMVGAVLIVGVGEGIGVFQNWVGIFRHGSLPCVLSPAYTAHSGASRGDLTFLVGGSQAAVRPCWRMRSASQEPADIQSTLVAVMNTAPPWNSSGRGLLHVTA